MPRAGLSTDVVVERAAALADAGGFAGLNLATLAEQLGVRVPSLYKHVGGLPDLQRRLAVLGLRDLLALLQAADAPAPPGGSTAPTPTAPTPTAPTPEAPTPTAPTHEAPTPTAPTPTAPTPEAPTPEAPTPGAAGPEHDRGARVRAFGLAYRGYARAHPGRYAAALRAPGPEDTEHGAVAAEVTALLLDALSPYALTGEPAVHAARALRAAMHGFVALEAAGGFALPVGLDASYARMLDLLVDGLGSAA